MKKSSIFRWLTRCSHFAYTPLGQSPLPMDKLKEELDLLQGQGVIVLVTVPTEWCAPIVVTPKKNSDKIRLCIDLSHLNRYVRRERYQSAPPAQAVADIAAEKAKVFTKIN